MDVFGSAGLTATWRSEDTWGNFGKGRLCCLYSAETFAAKE